MIPKQPISLFFGSTDQDTSKKRVQLGDLIRAVNVRQVKGGEFSKRDGITQVAQTYPTAITADAITSPDGVQVLVRDTSDHVYARSYSNTSNQDQGHADRILCKVNTRFPATGTGLQLAPMAKWAGNYVVWLLDSGHFQIAEVNPLTSKAGHSATCDAETVVQKSVSLSVSDLSSAASTTVRSFAVVDDLGGTAFLWIVWVDWSAHIYALKVARDNVNTVTFYTVYSNTPHGTILPAYTSISASIITGNVIAVAACGIQYDTTDHAVSPGHAGGAATGFRAGYLEVANNNAQTIAVHFYLSANGTSSGEVDIVGEHGFMTGAACTVLSTVGGFQTDPLYWWYAFVGNGGVSVALGLVLVRVKTSDLTCTVYTNAITPSTAPGTYGLPTDWSATNYSRFGWFWNAQLAAKETALGVEIVVTYVPYYITAAGTWRAWNPDYLYTDCFAFSLSVETWSTKWTKRGCCVAQGWLRLRDQLGAHIYDGKDYFLTQWEDKESLQSCYHLREWSTGNILAQLAYGLASHCGHVGTRDAQAAGYCSDVQQPMAGGVDQHDGLPLRLLLGLQSANQDNCVDVAIASVTNWDFSAAAAPIWQPPAVFGTFALAPGPIPTVCNGFQPVREAGPLVFPSRLETYLGEPTT
jgi:hypothetical protein